MPTHPPYPIDPVTISTFPPPSDLGFCPTTYPSWRPSQPHAILTIATTQTHVTALALPVGSGKSLVGLAASTLLSERAVYLTESKALQSQYIESFDARPGLCDVRGRSNYECAMKGVGTCEYGSILRCPHRRAPAVGVMDTDCAYEQAVDTARESDRIITNYAFFLRMANREGTGNTLGPIDMLVCDEAHSIPGVIASYLRHYLKWDDFGLLKEVIPDANYPRDRQWWVHFATRNLIVAIEEADKARVLVQMGGDSKSAQHLMTWDRIVATLRIVANEYKDQAGTWEVESDQDGYYWEPLNIRDYAGPLLFAHAKRVVLMSGTITAQWVESQLGLKPDEYTYVESESQFGLRYSPVTIITNVPKVSSFETMSQEDVEKWLSIISQIVCAWTRTGLSGIVHTKSYSQSQRIRDYLFNTLGRDHVVSHSRGGTEEAVSRYKALIQGSSGSDSRYGYALVSPAVSTGYDFPGDECRWQVLAKVPFQDTRGAITRARLGLDYPVGSPEREAGNALAASEIANTIMQIYGRGVRSESDKCELFITDGHMRWWWMRNQSMFPSWFRSRVSMMPNPRGPDQ